MSEMSWTGDALCAAELPTAARIADSWMESVLGTSYIAMRRADLRSYLLEQAERLLVAVTAPRFDRSSARDVGAAMVAVHVTDTASLEASLLVLGRELSVAATTPGRTARIAAVQAALGAGYAEKLKVTTRAQQERIGMAAARASAEQARWTSEARFQAVFADALVGMSVIDVQGGVLEVNRSMCDLLGFAADELTSRSVFSFLHPDDDPQIWAQIHDLLAGTRDSLRTTKCAHRKDGAALWIDMVMSLVRDADGTPRFVVCMVEDITDRQRLEDRLRHQAEHDPLTGLPNRTLFFERLDDGRWPTPIGDVGRSVLPGPGRVQGHQRHPRPRRRRPAAAAPSADRLTCATAGPATWWPGMGGDEFVVAGRAAATGRP